MHRPRWRTEACGRRGVRKAGPVRLIGENSRPEPEPISRKETSVKLTAWFRAAGTPLLCLAFLPVGVFADPPVKEKEADKPAALDAAGLAARIDKHLADRWEKNKAKPAPLTSDTQFVRRTYLDIAGRIPEVS